jgi:pimeloyl-ACP methyl ester carboxylesterase
MTLVVLACLGLGLGSDPRSVAIPTPDGGAVHADRFGSGEHCVVLVHGARFDKGSWEEQARALTEAGLCALAIDLRGYGQSIGGSRSSVSEDGYPIDVLAAVRYLRDGGATAVSIVGGSLGGWAAAQAAVAAKPGEIDRLVLLAASPIEHPERMHAGRILFVTARDDRRGGGVGVPRLPEIRDQLERAPDPKELLVVEGSAHAQHLFGTAAGGLLLGEIVRFLTGP